MKKFFEHKDKTIQLLTTSIDKPLKITPLPPASSPFAQVVQGVLPIALHQAPDLDFSKKTPVEQITLLRDTLSKIEQPQTE
jgi:hypothetical protein